MSILGNLLWIILGGFLISIEYILAGIAMCLTIIGIPFGLQSIKLGILALVPFGREVVDQPTGSGFLTQLHLEFEWTQSIY